MVRKSRKRSHGTNNIATIPNAIRFGGSALGDVLAPVTFGTSPFIGGAAGELGGQWWEDKPLDYSTAALEGALNYYRVQVKCRVRAHYSVT